MNDDNISYLDQITQHLTPKNIFRGLLYGWIMLSIPAVSIASRINGQSISWRDHDPSQSDHQDSLPFVIDNLPALRYGHGTDISKLAPITGFTDTTSHEKENFDELANRENEQSVDTLNNTIERSILLTSELIRSEPADNYLQLLQKICSGSILKINELNAFFFNTKLLNVALPSKNLQRVYDIMAETLQTMDAKSPIIHGKLTYLFNHHLYNRAFIFLMGSELTIDNDITAHKSIHGLYNQDLNLVFLKSAMVWQPISYFNMVIAHELHHASVVYQQKMRADQLHQLGKLTKRSTDSLDYHYNCPCEIGSTDTMPLDCSNFKTALTQVLKRKKQLILLLQSPLKHQQLGENNRQLLNHYRNIFPIYQPLMSERYIGLENLSKTSRQKVLTHQRSKTIFKDLEKLSETLIFKIKDYKLENGNLIAQYQSFSEKYRHLAPITDFMGLITSTEAMHFSKQRCSSKDYLGLLNDLISRLNQDPAKMTPTHAEQHNEMLYELDAHLHGLYSTDPNVYCFFIRELDQYHYSYTQMQGYCK